MITLIAAVSNNMVLADDSGIPWAGTMPSDVAFFREQTLKGVVVMGRIAYEELAQPLKHRENLVLTHQAEVRDGFSVISKQQVLKRAQNEDIWIIGGGNVYEQFMDTADTIVLNRIDVCVPGTVLFTDISANKFTLKSYTHYDLQSGDSYSFDSYIYTRR